MQMNIIVTHVMVYTSVRSCDQIVAIFTTPDNVRAHFIIHTQRGNGVNYVNQYFPNVSFDVIDADLLC